MKIECIRTYHLRCQLDQPFGFSQWYYGQRNVLIIEVVSDQGVSGWGECYGPADVTQGCVEKFYAPRIIGMNPIATDAIWQHMWRASLDFARGGVMMGAMSGIDMALWDLKGKLLGQSVSELMGGRLRDKVTCYATGMYYVDQPEEQLLETLVEEGVGYANQGFEAMKIKVGKNLRFDERFSIALREALPNTELMADSNHAYDLPEAIRMGRVLDELNFRWFEEPLSPEFNHQFRQLQDKLDLPLATGECEQTRFGFRRLIETGGVQILQPDLAYCGGPSEALKIRAMASASGINCVAHVWGTQLNLAAGTHFLATGYSEPGRLEEKTLLLEYDRTENPLRDNIYSEMIDVTQGKATVPTSPGLGVTIDTQAMQEFLVTKTENKA